MFIEKKPYPGKGRLISWKLEIELKQITHEDATLASQSKLVKGSRKSRGLSRDELGCIRIS